VKKTDLAYMAGIVDGEGCIRFSHRIYKKTKSISYLPKIDICNTQEVLPRRFQFAFGGGVYKERKREGCKVSWRWVVQGEVAYVCAKALLPYLVIKRAQAELIIQSWEDHTKYRKRTLFEREADRVRVQAIKELNKKGDEKARDEEKRI